MKLRKRPSIVSGGILIVIGLIFLGFINVESINLQYILGALLIFLGISKIVTWSE